MTKPMMDLRELVEKSGDADLLREMIGFAAERRMELEVGGQTGAGYGQKSPERLAQRNGYRDRSTYTSTADPRRGRGTAHSEAAHGGSYFPSFLEPRRAVEQALRAVIQEAYVHGVSTRAMDDLVQAMGGTGISKSQVSRLCEEIDERVDAFLTRPIEGEWPYLWIDATYLKVRQGGRIVSVAVTIAVGVNTDGRREVLGMAIGPSEAFGSASPFWTDFLRDLMRRGLTGVKLVISDAHEGIKAATARVLSTTWQRCRVGPLKKARSADSIFMAASCGGWHDRQSDPRSVGILCLRIGSRDLVPDDHILARVDRVIDLGWLRAEVADLYAPGVGRPGIDPEAAVRLMLAGFLLGIVHDRRLLREAQVNLAIRWFAGFGLNDRLPDHSSLTRIRQRWGADRFRRIFERTVRDCVGAGIAKGEVVHVDASLIRADVSWETLEESLDVRLGGVGSSGRRCIGQGRQPCLGLTDVVEQDDRVELRELRRELVPGRLRDGGMGLHALERCQRRVIALGHPGAVAGLLHQLERRLEEVHVEPHVAIEPRQFGGRGDTGISAIAHHSTDHRSVLGEFDPLDRLLIPRTLFHMGLVILAIRTGPGEVDLRPSHQSLIVSFMKTLTLSVSRPSNGNGSAGRSAVITSPSRRCSRNSRGAHSVQPVETSGRVSVCTKLPLADGPLWATRSASM